jgi:hypothetical protein
VIAVGIGFAPAASTSTTGAPSATQAAATVTPDTDVLYIDGPYANFLACSAALSEVRQSPYFVSGSCFYTGGKWYLQYGLA